MSETGAFTGIDWTIVGAFLLATTLLGHLLRGKGNSLHGFFLGGRDIPWWAVSVSLVATQTSALTFIAVPAASGRNFPARAGIFNRRFSRTWLPASPDSC